MILPCSNQAETETFDDLFIVLENVDNDLRNIFEKPPPGFAE